MSLKKFHIIIYLGLLLTAMQSQGQISVKADIDSNDILIGDWIHYSLEVTHNKDMEILWPTLIDTIGKFEIIEVSEIDSSAAEHDMITKKRNITITHFDSGRQILPSLAIGYRKTGDSSYSFIKTDSFIVDVHTLAVDTSQMLKPIKPPLKVPLTFKELTPFLIIPLVILITALTLLYFERKNKNKPLFGPKAKPQIPPHIQALKKLREIEDSKLWQKGEIKTYHIQLTDTIRYYIEGRFDVPAEESTTPEILEFLNDLVDDKELNLEMKAFLELSDLVKFAKFKPMPDENDKCLKTAYDFVNKTKPQLFEEEKTSGEKAD